MLYPVVDNNISAFVKYGWPLRVRLCRGRRVQIYFPENRSIPFVHLKVQHLTGRRIKICLVAQINGITVSSDIIIIEFTAFDEHEAMASVKTI